MRCSRYRLGLVGEDTVRIDCSFLDSFCVGICVVFEIAAAMGSSLSGDGMYIALLWVYRFFGIMKAGRV